MMKFLVRYGAYLGISASTIIFAGFIMNSLTVYDEATELGTLILFNYTNELSPNFYSFIQLVSTLPLATVLIVTISLLGLYVKIERDNAKSKRSLDKFMLLSSEKSQLDLLYTQSIVKNSMYLSADEKLHFKNETNRLISEFNVFAKETTDITNLTLEEQLDMKNQTLDQYMLLKAFLEKIQDNIKLAGVISSIAIIMNEIDELTQKIGV